MLCDGWEEGESTPLLYQLDNGSKNHRQLDQKDDPRINPWDHRTMALPTYFFVNSFVSALYSIPVDYYLYDVLDVSADTVYPSTDLISLYCLC